jgi:hypothetical protein
MSCVSTLQEISHMWRRVANHVLSFPNDYKTTQICYNLHMSAQDILCLLFSIPKSEFYKYEQYDKELSLFKSIRQPAGKLGVRHF